MIRVEAVSETNCIVYLGDVIAPDVAARVAAASEVIKAAFGGAVIDLIPSYTSILIQLDILTLSVESCCAQLPALLESIETGAVAGTGRCIAVPVYYGPEVAPDMAAVMQCCGLSRAEVVARHSGRSYRVYAIGFAPGFCFLGQLDETLSVPRKASPSLKVAARSVGIAERQTAVYPAETPGGWHIIGRSCADMLALCSDAEAPLRVGDELSFRDVTREEFLALGGSLS